MKTIIFETDITASRQQVWETMLNDDTYREWTNVTWPGSYYIGKWAQGEDIKFLGPSGEGTLANILEFKPYDYLLAKHIAVMLKDGTEDRTSDTAKGWIGSTEAYTFAERNGNTHLKVEMTISPEWEGMFAESWPKGLAKLKEMCERQLATH